MSLCAVQFFEMEKTDCEMVRDAIKGKKGKLKTMTRVVFIIK
mgnify:CR=1 FL=1